MDPLCEKYYHISPYAYCAGNPINRIDKDGKIWDTIWDVANVIYDAGAAVYNHIIGDHEAAKSHWVDAGADLLTAVIPVVPAGASKAYKAVDKGVDANKMSKLHDSAKTGQEAHRQIERELVKETPGTSIEQTIRLDEHTTVRKDAILSDGTAVIIKPNTQSGIRSATKRANLMES